VAVLQTMAETDDSPWDTQERCAFAKALQSLMKHRAIELRMALRDGGGVVRICSKLKNVLQHICQPSSIELNVGHLIL